MAQDPPSHHCIIIFLQTLSSGPVNMAFSSSDFSMHYNSRKRCIKPPSLPPLSSHFSDSSHFNVPLLLISVLFFKTLLCEHTLGPNSIIFMIGKVCKTQLLTNSIIFLIGKVSPLLKSYLAAMLCSRFTMSREALQFCSFLSPFSCELACKLFCSIALVVRSHAVISLTIVIRDTAHDTASS